MLELRQIKQLLKEAKAEKVAGEIIMPGENKNQANGVDLR